MLAAIATTSQLPGDGAAQLEVISSLFSSLLLWVITIIGEDGHHQPHLSASSSSPVSLSIAIIISSSNILLFLFIASRTFPCFSRPHQAQLLPHCIDRRSSSSSFFFSSTTSSLLPLSVAIAVFTSSCISPPRSTASSLILLLLLMLLLKGVTDEDA